MSHPLAGSRDLWMARQSWPGRRGASFVAFAALLVLVPGCSLVSAGMVAEALFQVGAVQPVLLDNGTSRFNAREYEIFQKSQVALLKSWFVLNAALRDPGIATLPILAGKDDPVAWLTDHLEVEFVDGSEVFAIRLRGADSQAEDLKRLVDAVAKAYEKEVVYNDKQRRLVTRDALSKTAAGLREELVKKMADIEQLKKDLGENGADNPELKLKQLDLDILVYVYRQLRRSLELIEVESNAPARIRQIQPAVVSQQ